MDIKFLKKVKGYLEELQLTHFYSQLKGAYENYRRSNSNLWANTLCYFTTLSFIPILAIAFSIGRWFGIDKYYLKQLAESSPLNEDTINMILETTQTLLQNTRSGLIAGFGFISLGWVVITMFSVIEKALNSIWRVKKSRPFFRKFADYFITFLMLPVSIIGANILTNLKIDIFYTNHLIQMVAPYLALWIFFIVFYKVLPNTRVNIVPVIWSSFIVSFLLNQSNMLLVRLQLIIGTYNKIYGSFSVLLLSLIWLKVVWFLILIGAHFSYILQNRESLAKLDGTEKLSFNSKYMIAKIILKKFVENYSSNGRPMSPKEMSKELNIPSEIVIDTIESLKGIEYISAIDTDSSEEKKYKLTVNVNEISDETLCEDLKNLGESYNLTQ
ncbi:YihY/virulence factor BrkB family protein [uncultured Cetobacterium sp.]|uniref:YihY/virulence factor BrkB family protein n=1 Tax=uncultured Cetobacterium sp. TaxID=527638 RepID=UPI0026396AAC|nr:YihY/virulence factor BrkB family protein [uncultured Cetobacterium sp.]